MANRYSKIIEKLFFDNYTPGNSVVEIRRDEMLQIAQDLKITLPQNLGDVIYSFRFRGDLPESIKTLAPQGQEWLIHLAGKGRYRFSLEEILIITPNTNLTHTKILDSTPGLINMYSLSDEQALLAVLRYNRLIDTFLGLTCYSLQNHLRTTVPDIGQVETDEIYIGVDKKGAHYVIPVQAKGGRDKQGKVQIIQDIRLCAKKFANLLCIPVAAQFMQNDVIALFSFEESANGEIKILSERHYLLVDSNDLTEMEVKKYNARLD